ncbi:MAG: hypothetical protein ACI853_001554, partial [Paracoccaceae bacterium]
RHAPTPFRRLKRPQILRSFTHNTARVIKVARRTATSTTTAGQNHQKAKVKDPAHPATRFHYFEDNLVDLDAKAKHCRWQFRSATL